MRRVLFSLLPALAAVLSLCLIAFLLFSLKNPVSLDDGLRHFAMARLMSEQGIGSAHWSQFFSEGYFAHHSVDPWFLSNIAFLPLVSLGPVLAPKVFAIFSILLLIIAFLCAFHAFKTPPFPAAVGIVLLLFFEPTFLYRLLLSRPFELITSLTVIIVVAAMRRRPFLVALALSLCVLLSQLFLFPLLVALTCVLWRLTLRQWEEAILLMGWITAGLLAGFLLHPHPLLYFFYFRDTFVAIPFLPGLELGPEMRSGLFASQRVLVMLAVIILLHAELLREEVTWRKYHESGLSLLAFLTIVFLLLFSLWARAIDFLWPMTMLLLVLLLSLRPGLFHRMCSRLAPKKFQLSPAVGVLLLFLLCTSSFSAVATSLIATDHERSLSVYTDALAKVPSGSNVLNVDWSFFMGASAVRPDIQYATGIDPSYTYLDHPKALALLTELNTSKFQANPTTDDVRVWFREILVEYPSEYLVLFRSQHGALIDVLGEMRMQDLSGSRGIAVFDLRSFLL